MDQRGECRVRLSEQDLGKNQIGSRKKAQKAQARNESLPIWPLTNELSAAIKASLRIPILTYALYALFCGSSVLLLRRDCQQTRIPTDRCSVHRDGLFRREAMQVVRTARFRACA